MKQNKLSRKQRYYFTVSLGIILVLSVSVMIQSMALPRNLTLSPGQSFTLSVNFPLGFNTVKKELLSFGRLDHFFKRNLTLQSSDSTKYDIELTLFGKIPIKKLHVDVVEPPMVIPCGHAIGVLVSSRGVIVVGHIPVSGIDRKQYYPARQAGLKVGDVLLAVEDTIIHNVEDMERFLANVGDDRPLTLTIQRHEKIIKRQIQPVLTEIHPQKKYMLGIFIEDPAAGVGTLSYFTPSNRAFAGLGHQIANIGGHNGIKLEWGEIVLANISGIRTGSPGKPGEKIGIFNAAQNPIGKINKNCKFGIYGTAYPGFEDYIKEKPIPIAFSSQIKEGPALIYTVINGSEIEAFKVEIIKVYKQNQPKDKGLVVKVTDERLLEVTGGIIQGMSGSPIIQDGRLVGAVTHVFVNDPTKGYGVLAEWMVRESSQIPLTQEAS